MAAALDAPPPPVCARGECRLWIEGHGCVNDLVRSHGEHTLEEVGEYFGVTRERIFQIEAKALAKLSHPSRRHALEELLALAADSERPSTPLGRVQGAGPSLGDGGEVWRNQVPRPEPSLCRHPAAPHVVPPSPRRCNAELPPSLRDHAAELRTIDRRDRRYDTDCTRAEAAGLLELRPAREDCDTDGDAPALEPPEATPPSETPGVDTDADDDCEEREEPMRMSTSEKIDRLLEIEKEKAALDQEQDRLLSDPDVVSLIGMLQGMKRWPRPKVSAAPKEPAPVPAPTPTPTMRNGRAMPGARIAQVEAQLTAEPRGYREIAAAIGQRDTDCHACLRKLVGEGKAVKTGPGMFARAADPSVDGKQERRG